MNSPSQKGHNRRIARYTFIHTFVHLNPPRGAKWMGKGFIKQSLRVFSHHPLEGAGTHFLVQVEGSLPLDSDFPLKFLASF